MQEKEVTRIREYERWFRLRHDWLPGLPLVCQEEVQHRLVVDEVGLNEFQQLAGSSLLLRYDRLYSGRLKESMRTQILLNAS